MQDTKEQVSGLLKSGVRSVAWGIDQATDLAYKVAPDSWDKSTVRIAMLSAPCPYAACSHLSDRCQMLFMQFMPVFSSRCR